MAGSGWNQSRCASTAATPPSIRNIATPSLRSEVQHRRFTRGGVRLERCRLRILSNGEKKMQMKVTRRGFAGLAATAVTAAAGFGGMAPALAAPLAKPE